MIDHPDGSRPTRSDPRRGEHLAEELEIDIERITETTRFREDLDADSLDLYELVMELEDNYGVTVSEEQATRIKSVGDAVGFVLERVVSVVSAGTLSPSRGMRTRARRGPSRGAVAPARGADRQHPVLDEELRRSGAHALLLDRAARDPAAASPSSATACSGWRSPPHLSSALRGDRHRTA